MADTHEHEHDHDHEPQASFDEAVEVEINDVSSVTKRLSVKVAKHLVDAELDATYRQLKKTAQIKGFRKGKAPRAVLERHYGPQVERDVTGRIVSSTIAPIVSKHELQLVSQPQVSDAAINDDGTLSYVASVEVSPQFELPAYTGLKVKVEQEEVTDEMVDEQLEHLRERHADLAPVFEDRPLKEGDFAVIDYTTIVAGGGEPTTNENVTIELGSDQLIDEFEEKLPGTKVGGEVSIDVEFPEDHPDEKVAGHAVNYRVKVKAIKKKELPEVGDDLAKEVGADDLEDLKEKIREELGAHMEKQRKEKVHKEILTKILDGLEFEVPPTILEGQLRALHQSAASVLQERGMQVDKQSADELKEQLRDEAEVRAREMVVLEKIIAAEGIQVTEEDLNEEYQRLANAYQQPVASVAAYYEQSGRKNVLVSQLRETKALDFLERNNKVTK